MAQAPNGNDPYERARSNAGYLEAVAATHRGRWAVTDALFWLAHPLDDSPGGTRSPAARLHDLQRRVFAEDGDAIGDAAVIAAMRQLESEIRAERAAITSAVQVANASAGGWAVPVAADAAVDGDLVADGRAIADARAGVPVVDLTAAAAFVTDVPAAPAQPARVPARRRWLSVVALATAVLIGALAGSQLAAPLQRAVDGLSGGTAPTPTASATASASAAVLPLLAAQVFGRPQVLTDIPLTPMPVAFDPATFRYLGSAGFTDADGNGVTDSPYYAVRGAEQMVCLVAIPEGSGYLSTCARESEYPAAGLRLSWQSTDILAGADDGTATMVLDITVAWLPDASIETRGSGRSTLAR